MNDEGYVLEKVRRSLGRGGAAPTTPPQPPEIPDSVARLVRQSSDLPAVFAKNAANQKMIVSQAPAAEAAVQIVAFLAAHPIRTVAMARSVLLDRLALRPALAQAGLEVKTWDEMTLDQLYDFDCAITDVHCAIAESGSIAIKPSANHGRGLSLVPMYHIAVVEPRQILPDMIDLFAHLRDDPDRGNVILISGPSKTADIEMNVVTGVHGPNVVHTFIVQ
jgi:L-lactate dehydrogenase complex protein LldG